MVFSDPQYVLQQAGVSEGMYVVDFGAGGGGYTLSAADMVGPDGVVYAVDIQKELLKRIAEHARQREGDVEIIWGDLERERSTGLADGLADVVVAANVTFQLEHKDRVFAEAHRLLRPKGRLVFIDWSDSHGGLGPEPDAVFTEIQARGLVEAAGFTIERDLEAGAHHYGFVARRA